MPSSLPKYSGLISDRQLSILEEFISLHDGISKAKVLGRLLEAWEEAGKPVLGDRKAQLEQSDIDTFVAKKVRKYLDLNLESIVINLVNNKSILLSSRDSSDGVRSKDLDINLVHNQGEDNDIVISKVVESKDNSLVTNLVDNFEKKGKDKDIATSEVVHLKNTNQVDNYDNQQETRDLGMSEKENNLNSNSGNEQEEIGLPVSLEDINLENQQIDLEFPVWEIEIKQDANLGDNLKKEDKEIPFEDSIQETEIDATVSKVIEEEANLVDTLVNTPEESGEIPPAFLALPLGIVTTGELAKSLGLDSARVSEIANGKKKTLPFPEFRDYLSVEPKLRITKKEKELKYYEWTKLK
jgi:hypothetical protein